MARITVDADVELDMFDDDDLIDELEGRGFSVNKDEVSDTGGFYLPRLYDRHQLRDHLVNVAGLGSYVSDEELTSKIKELLIYG